MKIFLDDVREPADCIGYMYRRIGKDNLLYIEKWCVVRNYFSFIGLVQLCQENNIEITHISFDHDLGYVMTEDQGKIIIADDYKEEDKTGLDCAKFIKELYQREGKKLPIMFVHSMNPVGTQHIIDLFK